MPTITSDLLEQLISFRLLDLVFALDVIIVPGLIKVSFQVILIILSFKTSPLFNAFTCCEVGFVLGEHFETLLAIHGILSKEAL